MILTFLYLLATAFLQEFFPIDLSEVLTLIGLDIIIWKVSHKRRKTN